MEYKRAIREFSSTSFLFGPRGTGKSTWLREKYPNAVYIDFLDSETFRYYSARPERIGSIPGDYPGKRCVVIDEVQKVPEILSDVHRIIEENKQLQFILTGSSSRKLKRKGVDLLAGRAHDRRLHPFLASELGDDFDLPAALNIGMLPLVVASQEPEKTLKGYIGLYLNEEVKEEGFVRNVGGFSRFLESISLSQGSLLNLSEISRECEVKRNTVDSYISILEDLLIAVRIPVFKKKAKRETVQNWKFYFFDCGVFQSLRPRGPLDDTSPLQGIALETLVMQHLRAWIDYSGGDVSLFFWRTRGGSEVDFILYGEGVFAALEVKNTLSPRARDTRGLKSFKKEYPEAAIALLYRGEMEKVRDGVPWVPVERFLRSLTPTSSLHDAIRVYSI